jgi:hypothetical protein
LMFEQERFSCDLARAARAEEFRKGHEQMDRQEQQIAHESKIIMPANLRKTAPQRRFMPKLPIRHPQDHEAAPGCNADSGIGASRTERRLWRLHWREKYGDDRASAENGGRRCRNL